MYIYMLWATQPNLVNDSVFHALLPSSFQQSSSATKLVLHTGQLRVLNALWPLLGGSLPTWPGSSSAMARSASLYIDNEAEK